MKSKKSEPVPVPAPTEDEIRDYAQHLYEQSGRQPGHDEENWFEAKACLEANIPKQDTRRRLHRHRTHELLDGVEYATVEIRSLEPLAIPESRVAGMVLSSVPSKSRSPKR